MLKSTYLPAGVFNEPLSDLMKVLASLVDADNHILVKGFLDRVWLSFKPSLILSYTCRKALTCHEARVGRLQIIAAATHSRSADCMFPASAYVQSRSGSGSALDLLKPCPDVR